MASKQETFDHVVRSLITQGRKAIDPAYGCRYRTSEGLKCAAGQCIPDERYSTELETLTVGVSRLIVNGTYSYTTPEDLDRRQRLLDALEGYDLEIVEKLQVAHDNSDSHNFIDDFRTRARLTAEHSGLNDAACNYHTKQQTFDKVVTALIAQGRPSRSGPDGQGGCLYLTITGLKCAAGHLIPEDKYLADFEGLTITASPSLRHENGELMARRASLLAALDGHDLELVRELQSAHDSALIGEGFVSSFVNSARDIATRHGLDTTVCGTGGAL